LGAGLVNTPRLQLEAENYLFNLIETGQFSLAKKLVELGLPEKVDKKALYAVVNSYKYVKIDKIEDFIDFLSTKKRFSYLFSKEAINSVIKISVDRETYIVQRILKKLIRPIATLKEFDENGFLLTHYAAGNLFTFFENKELEFRYLFSSKSLYKILLNLDVEIDLPDQKYDVTPVMISSYFGDLEAVSFLLNNKVDHKRKISTGFFKEMDALKFALKGKAELESKKNKLYFDGEYFYRRNVKKYERIIELLSKE
tara:strand:+ start:50638 stop:51402 length:765 start_codon:yes stop_codon:yes gene_type:complete